MENLIEIHVFEVYKISNVCVQIRFVVQMRVQYFTVLYVLYTKIKNAFKIFIISQIESLPIYFNVFCMPIILDGSTPAYFCSFQTQFLYKKL